MNRKALMRHAKRGMEILLRQGPKAFMNKVKLKIAENHVVYVAPQDEKILAYADLNLLDASAFENLRDANGKPHLAVQLHLYYEDLLPEFVENLNHIPCPFDLYISIRDLASASAKQNACLKNASLEQGASQSEEKNTDAKQDATAQRISDIEQACQSITMLHSVTVKPTQNRGRDIAPMYVLFGKELRTYKYVLHMHSKKSLYQGSEQLGWRQYSVGSLIGSREQATRIISMLESDDSFGLIYPERFVEMAPEAYGWLSDEAKGREFMESIGVPFHGGIFLYPAGSFFLVRNAAIPQIWNRNLKYTDFDEEAGQIDGTLAHVLERALGQVVTQNGFHHAIVADERKEVHIDRDKHTFAPVFLRDKQKMLMDLSAYDVISFDIFDTLLTRVFYHPADVFTYMEHVLTQGNDEDTTKYRDFKNSRIQAEIAATETHGAKTNLRDIYNELQQALHLMDEERDMLYDLEIQVEQMALEPRREMFSLYQELLAAGKKIILTSDMYLTSEILKPILEKNGITGFERLYISCDEGLRKDALSDEESLWTKVLSDYKGMNLAHVGDNMQSDWQMLSDRQEKTSWILNPRQAEQIAGVADVENASQELLVEARRVREEVTKEANRVGKAATTQTVSHELLHGLTINGGLYNSPFALYPAGAPEFRDSYTLGYTVFGPLMYEYMRWLNETTADNAKLAFLAREGYIFQQVYEAMYGDRAKEHLYLLASRRAISVAAIRAKEDILEICRRDYDGDLRNLLRSRFGAPDSITSKLPEKYVHFKVGAVDDEYERTMKLIEPYFDEIVAYASEERENYLRYFKSQISDADLDRTVYVDIGYAGTIQYYLSKLLDRPVTGAYMAVFKEHEGLALRDCEVLAMYRKGADCDFAETLEQTQLFLESVLQAPYGQLLHFDADGPVYKDEAKPADGIVKLQDGLLDYVKQRAQFAENRSLTIGDEALRNEVESADTRSLVAAERQYMEAMYRHFLSGAYIGEEVGSIFTVEDTYSQDTTLHYDGKSKKWKI